MKKLLILISTALVFSCNNGKPNPPDHNYFEVSAQENIDETHSVTWFYHIESGTGVEMYVGYYYNNNSGSPQKLFGWKVEDGGEPKESEDWDPWENASIADTSITYVGYGKVDDHGIVTINADPVTIHR